MLNQSNTKKSNRFNQSDLDINYNSYEAIQLRDSYPIMQHRRYAPATMPTCTGDKQLLTNDYTNHTTKSSSSSSPRKMTITTVALVLHLVLMGSIMLELSPSCAEAQMAQFHAPSLATYKPVVANQQQQSPPQQSQLLPQYNSNSNSNNNNQFRPILPPTTQSSALREQLARPDTVQQQSHITTGGTMQPLQTAESSQDPYMSSNELNDIMRSHQAHYDGSANRQHPSNGNGNQARGWNNNNNNHHNSNNNNQQNMQQVQNQKYDGPQQASPSNQAGSATNDGGYYDENDYDDEGSGSSGDQAQAHNDNPQGGQRGSAQNYNEAPGRGIAGSSTNRNQQRNFVNRQYNGNDYGPGNDDAYFNRRGSQQQRPMRPAASYNRHRQGGGAGGGGDGRESMGRQNEQEGFGPGPNEAFIAEKNEASNGNEPDDDGSYDGPSGGDGAGADDDGPPQGFGSGPPASGPDQQSSNQLNYKEPVGGQQPMTGGATSGGVGAGGGMGGGESSGGDGDDSDGSGDGSGADGDGPDADFPIGYDPSQADMDDSPRAPVPAASLSGRQMGLPNQGRGVSLTGGGARTSASAPAPSAAASPIGMRLQQQQQQLTTPTGSLQHQQQHQQQSRQQQPRLQQQQQQTMPAYNPQNNPSHVGKYFIN